MKGIVLSAGLVLAAAVAAQGGVCIKEGDRIGFLGDSITAYGNWDAGYLPLTMKGLEIAGVRAVKVAAGWGGDKSNDMLRRLDRDVLSKNVKWMTLSCGVNDVWHGAKGVPLEDYKKNISAILDKCAASNVTVVVMTATMIKEDAKIRETDKTPGNKLTKDGVHMDFRGNCMMAECLLKTLGVDEMTMPAIREAWRHERGAAVAYLPLTQAEFEYIDADEGTFDEALQRRFIKMIEAEMKKQ